MNNEIWSYWMSANIEQSDYDIHLIREKGWDFTVILIDFENKQRELHIAFDQAYCFRSTYELFTCMRMDKAYNQQGRDFFLKRQFYKITNSEYVAWVSEQSGGVSNSFGNLEHYVICTDDQMVEILSYGEPQVTFVDVENNE